MARTQTFSLVMVAVLVLAIAFWVAIDAQPGLVTHVTHTEQEGIHFISVGTDSPAAPSVIVCDGCSGGSGGPG